MPARRPIKLPLSLPVSGRLTGAPVNCLLVSAEIAIFQDTSSLTSSLEQAISRILTALIVYSTDVVETQSPLVSHDEAAAPR